LFLFITCVLDIQQVFFPVGFWAYKPNLVYDQPPYPASIDITAKSGRFDPDRFDHVSFYCTDYIAARHQALETGYTPAADMYELFVWYQPNVHVLRAVEPALRLQYREEASNCIVAGDAAKSRCPPPRLPASQSQLALLVFEHQQRLDRQQIDVMHRQRGENIDQMKPEMLRRR
jgi:chondroitin polymerizing factor/chondroitin polymerizing factor 2